jgi:hypothetical protein
VGGNPYNIAVQVLSLCNPGKSCGQLLTYVDLKRGNLSIKQIHDLAKVYIKFNGSLVIEELLIFQEFGEADKLQIFGNWADKK